MKKKKEEKLDLQIGRQRMNVNWGEKSHWQGQEINNFDANPGKILEQHGGTSVNSISFWKSLRDKRCKAEYAVISGVLDSDKMMPTWTTSVNIRCLDEERQESRGFGMARTCLESCFLPWMSPVESSVDKLAFILGRVASGPVVKRSSVNCV